MDSLGEEGSPTRPRSEVRVVVLLPSFVGVMASLARGGTALSLDAIIQKLGLSLHLN